MKSAASLVRAMPEAEQLRFYIHSSVAVFDRVCACEGTTGVPVSRRLQPILLSQVFFSREFVPIWPIYMFPLLKPCFAHHDFLPIQAKLSIYYIIG